MARSYGSEVWAPYLLRHLNDRNFTTLCDKNPGELLHIKFCKLILGVHRKATNHAVRGVLGSLPILIPILCHSIKYWWHLTLVLLRVFPKYIFLRGLLQPPLDIVGLSILKVITLNLLPVYRYGHPLSIDTKISTNH